MENCDNLLGSLMLKTKSIIATFSSKTKMSTSSSATALGRDQVPSNDPHLKSKICMFIVTRKDGTLLNMTSVSEENIMEICVMLGHTHPLGVPWYSATESVAQFCMTEDMQWASCGAIKAMELWDEPIAIQIMAPSEHHIRAYITIVGGDPSKPWSLPSEGEDDALHLLVTLTWVGALCITSKQSLATLQTQSCINLWRISVGRSHFMSCMHLPATLKQLLGENHQGVVILMWMTRR